MNKGYIVWNLSNYGDGYEIYGVYKSIEQAEKCFRKVVRTKLGYCPRNYEKMIDELDKYADGEDSFRITPFEEI